MPVLPPTPAVHPLEGQCLLHGQHELGSSSGCVPALQLQPGALRPHDARLSEALRPGRLLLRVLPEPGAVGPAGGKTEWGRQEARRAISRAPGRSQGWEVRSLYGQEVSQRLLMGTGMERKWLLGESGWG